MKLAHIAVLGLTLLGCMSGTASAASGRSTPYPFRCDGALSSFIEPGRVCYYFAMRVAYGDNGFVTPFSGYGPEGYADPRAWRFSRMYRLHRR